MNTLNISAVSKKSRKVKFIKDKKGAFRWQLIGKNGKDIVGESGEGYVKKSYCRKIAHSIFSEPVIFEE